MRLHKERIKQKSIMDDRERTLLKKLKRQNIIADIIWFLLFALFAVLLFLYRT